MTTYDILIIGAGIIGLTMAREAKRRHPRARLLILDKESRLGCHASGRNSGVLHAGFYYSPDTLKARLTWQGNQAWTRYCQERKLTLDPCGKLVVARHPSEHPALRELYRRGLANNVPVELVDEQQAAAIEPRARTVGQALWSPATSVVDPGQLLDSLVAELRATGVEIALSTPYLGRQGHHVRTSAGTVSPGLVINAAGLHADQVARDFGFCQKHVILPFKGLYLHGDAPPDTLRTHIYPVPELLNPFLGVHLTRTVTGGLKAGPTAIPAFWREHYQGLTGFRLAEAVDITSRQALLLLRNDFGFRRLAWQELAKYRKKSMIDMAAQLVHSLDGVGNWHWGKAGIRAQLLEKKTRKLEMDFRYERDERSFHILNAVSPGLTCALSFSHMMWDALEGDQGSV